MDCDILAHVPDKRVKNGIRQQLALSFAGILTIVVLGASLCVYQLRILYQEGKRMDRANQQALAVLHVNNDLAT